MTRTSEDARVIAWAKDVSFARSGMDELNRPSRCEMVFAKLRNQVEEGQAPFQESQEVEDNVGAVVGLKKIIVVDDGKDAPATSSTEGTTKPEDSKPKAPPAAKKIATRAKPVAKESPSPFPGIKQEPQDDEKEKQKRLKRRAKNTRSSARASSEAVPAHMGFVVFACTDEGPL